MKLRRLRTRGGGCASSVSCEVCVCVRACVCVSCAVCREVSECILCVFACVRACVREGVRERGSERERAWVTEREGESVHHPRPRALLLLLTLEILRCLFRAYPTHYEIPLNGIKLLFDVHNVPSNCSQVRSERFVIADPPTHTHTQIFICISIYSKKRSLVRFCNTVQ